MLLVEGNQVEFDVSKLLGWSEPPTDGNGEKLYNIGYDAAEEIKRLRTGNRNDEETTMAFQQCERTANLTQAEAALTQAVADLAKQFGLTTAEVCMALSTIQTRWVGYQLRDERESKS